MPNDNANVIEMNKNEYTEENVDNKNILDELDFKTKEEWESALNDMSLEIENFREELASKKYVLQFDNDVKDKVKYFQTLTDYIYKELEWSGYEFFTVEALYDNITKISKQVSENPDDPVEFEYAVLEAFISLVLKNTGKGAKEVKKRKMIVKPFNNTYYLYEEDVRKLKNLQEKYTAILNSWQDEPENKQSAPEGEYSAEPMEAKEKNEK